MKRLCVWFLVSLVAIMVACDSEPEEESAVSPTPTLAISAEPTIDTEIAPLPAAEGEPTYISVSQFPVAVVDTASAQQPAFVSIEMAGFDISELRWQIGRYEESCDRLVGMGRIQPDNSESWPDGVHQASFSWPALGTFLSDGERADFVYVELDGARRVINGRYRQGNTGEGVEAQLVINAANNGITGIQSASGAAISAVAGDSFQLFHDCLQSDGTIRVVPGVELLFLEGGQIEFEQRPLTSGDYFLHLAARGTGTTAASTTDFLVNNDFLVPDYRVYLNTEYGFQFLYPESWQTLQLQDNKLETADGAGTTELTVTLHPGMTDSTARDLKNLALSQFGDVSILFEDQVLIDEIGALWTAYGYTGADGPHTGVLLAFTNDGMGYTVDLDGPETSEAHTISLMNTLIENWLFRPDITTPRAREWTAVFFDDLAMPVKATYFQEELDNGWRRFIVGDGISFLAVRTAPLQSGLFQDDLSDIVDHWKDVAASGVADFAVSDDYAFSLNGREWTRTDFAYLGQGSLEIQGFVMAAEIDGRAVVYWAEMPITRYEEQSAVFLLSLASLR